MKKITYVSLFVLFFASHSYSQNRVVSNEITVSGEQNSTLLNSFAKYRAIEVDLARFKKGISS